MEGLRFLLLEDSLLDAELIQATLTEGEVVCELVQVKTRMEFQTALEEIFFDIILADYSLPSFDGISALEIACNICPETPFIFVTATMGEEVAIETLKSGATDYILKQRLDRLVPSIKRAIREAEYLRACNQSEAELHRREQEFRALVENSPDIIARFDRDLRTIYVNPAIQWATGLKLENFIGKTAGELWFSQEISISWETKLRSCFAKGEKSVFEFNFPSPDGIRYYQAQIVPEFAIDNSVQSLLGIARDVTPYKQAEKTLRQQKEELEQANRIKDEFLAVLSHELRSPLNPILGWSKLLRSRKPDEATLKRALETIERNAKLQTQLIEDLLDVSRIIQGKLTLHPVATDLVKAIEAAIETVRLAASVKSIDLRFEILDFGLGKKGTQGQGEVQENFTSSLSSLTPQFQVTGDPNRLQQIVWNLLSNAIKFTPLGGRVEVILESLEEEGEHGENLSLSPLSLTYAQITVKDTGIGIKADFIPYVFESFRQADGSTTRKYGGLGLGLAIARQLVELHGGKIFAESLGSGQGATFTVRIPMLKDPELKVLSAESDFFQSELSSLRVLVVDDNPDSLELLVMVLESYGAITTAVDSVASALEILPSFKPDALVSDIGMPNEDGYTLIRKIRALPPEQGGKIPAIALTAYAAERDRNEAISAGFQKHISKPVNPEELAKAIAELLRS
ncbi:MAG: response regulator [Cyanomargarita calcarea GSE-NOS-MK-12-04C]|jgi:PAS domain S-box-containing protein|uniref:histidine kinase n=1 Tax=Cyanomargarita calcarea GSE-NOS-MK-12-04C TaxID=2839659 RepID=A0A951UT00_9CYAN|nr:response regulator [Cyanomargarita calcarea GSE-NOS-MK-12-04C]